MLIIGLHKFNITSNITHPIIKDITLFNNNSSKLLIDFGD